jgi:adenine-specific DNA-methyltransferase
VSLVTFTKTTGATSEFLAGSADYLLWYAKDLDSLKFRQHWIQQEGDRIGYRWLMFPDGTFRGMTAAESRGEADVPATARLYTPDNITSQRPPGDFPVEYRGKVYRPGRSYWKTGEAGMQRLAIAGRLHVAENSLRYVRFADDFPYRAPNNIWTDTGTGNFTDPKIFVVQTSTKVIQRCVLMATDPGDLVLDPTCGSGTTAFVAEQWGRRWITIDTSRVAMALARTRLISARLPYYRLADATGTGSRGDVSKGFVYERVPHVTLKSIATNPDIK